MGRLRRRNAASTAAASGGDIVEALDAAFDALCEAHARLHELIGLCPADTRLRAEAEAASAELKQHIDALRRNLRERY